MIEINCTTATQIRYQANPTDAQGKPAKIQAGSMDAIYTTGTGTSVADANDSNVIHLVPDLGAFAIDVGGDSDLNEGPDHVHRISEIVQGVCENPQAENLGGSVTLEPRP